MGWKCGLRGDQDAGCRDLSLPRFQMGGCDAKAAGGCARSRRYVHCVCQAHVAVLREFRVTFRLLAFSRTVTVIEVADGRQ